MKTLLASTILAASLWGGLGAGPAAASAWEAGTHLATGVALPGPDLFERRGRGHGGHDDGPSHDAGDDHGGRGGHGGNGGHGSDDDTDDDGVGDDNGGDNDGGHGGRPRVPGGSGCDDPEDLIEHPECLPPTAP